MTPPPRLYENDEIDEIDEIDEKNRRNRRNRRKYLTKSTKLTNENSKNEAHVAAHFFRRRFRRFCSSISSFSSIFFVDFVVFVDFFRRFFSSISSISFRRFRRFRRFFSSISSISKSSTEKCLAYSGAFGVNCGIALWQSFCGLLSNPPNPPSELPCFQSCFFPRKDFFRGLSQVLSSPRLHVLVAMHSLFYQSRTPFFRISFLCLCPRCVFRYPPTSLAALRVNFVTSFPASLVLFSPATILSTLQLASSRPPHCSSQLQRLPRRDFLC